VAIAFEYNNVRLTCGTRESHRLVGAPAKMQDFYNIAGMGIISSKLKIGATSRFRGESRSTLQRRGARYNRPSHFRKVGRERKIDLKLKLCLHYWRLEPETRSNQYGLVAYDFPAMQTSGRCRGAAQPRLSGGPIPLTTIVLLSGAAQGTVTDTSWGPPRRPCISDRRSCPAALCRTG
jgi:hypothetical protein